MTLAAMNDTTFLVVLFLVVAATLGAIYYSTRKRRKDLERVAAGLGLRFEAREKQTRLPNQDFRALPVFARSRRRSNFLIGRRSIGEMFLADVKVGSGEDSYKQSVACFHLPGRGLPAFELRPESWAHKLAQVFGYKDIDFEASPEFSKNYLLRGEEEQAVRELFGAELIHFFAGEKGWAVEGMGDWLSVYRERQVVGAKDLKTFVAEGEAVARLFTRSR